MLNEIEGLNGFADEPIRRNDEESEIERVYKW